MKLLSQKMLQKIQIKTPLQVRYSNIHKKKWIV